MSALVERDVSGPVLEEEGAEVVGVGNDGDAREDHDAAIEKADGREVGELSGGC